MRMTYDVVVVGGGHAGCEAAAAAANMGEKTLLVTMDMNKIAQMSCNPAVGGIAKGQIVREIDALGGLMGIVTDESAIQFRLLNRSKGPAMWSPRSQCDREKFIMNWRRKLESIENLEIWQDSAVEIILKEENGKKKARGIKTKMGVEIEAKSVILTCGTFLDGLMHIGKIQMKGGRVSEPASYGLTEQLKEEGFSVGRMKTGTPVRLDGKTIDFKKMKRQTAEDMKAAWKGKETTILKTLTGIDSHICRRTEENLNNGRAGSHTQMKGHMKYCEKDFQTHHCITDK